MNDKMDENKKRSILLYIFISRFLHWGLHTNNSEYLLFYTPKAQRPGWFLDSIVKLTLFAQDWQMASSLHQSLGFSTTVPIIALASVSSLIGGEKELANKEPMLDNKGTLRIQSLPFSLSIQCINCILNNPTNTFVFFRSLLFHRTNNH
jgi:hypothetical protein